MLRNQSLSMKIQIQTVYALLLMLLCIQGRSQTDSFKLWKKIDFSNDARFDRDITLVKNGTELKQLLKSLSSDKLKLSCDERSQNQKLQISLHKSKLSILLSAISQLFRGNWYENKSDNSISFFVLNEVVSQREGWWKSYFKARDEQLETLESKIFSFLTRDYSKDPETTVANSNDALMPISNTGTFEKIIDSLKSSDKAKIAASFDLLPFYNAVPVQLSQESPVLFPVSALSDHCLNELRLGLKARLQNKYNPELVNGAYLSITNNVTSLTIGLYTKNDQIYSGVADTYPYTIDKSISLAAEFMNPGKLSLQRVVREYHFKPRDSWKPLLSAEEKTVWKNQIPSGVSRGERTVIPPRYEALNRLSRQGKFDFIADYYSTGGKPMSKTEFDSPLKSTLDASLNHEAVLQNMSWKKMDDLYLFRSNRWYIEDKLEVDNQTALDLIKKVVAISKMNDKALNAQIRAHLDLMSEIQSKFTMFQIFNGLRSLDITPFIQNSPETMNLNRFVSNNQDKKSYNDYFFTPIINTIGTQCHLNSLYITLLDEQRDKLINGTLALSDLSDEQHSLLGSICAKLETNQDVRKNTGNYNLALVGTQGRPKSFYPFGLTIDLIKVNSN